MGMLKLWTSSTIDLKPILDEGALLSIGGTRSAAKLSSILGLEFTLKPPRAAYRYGLGTAGLQSKPVVAM